MPDGWHCALGPWTLWPLELLMNSLCEGDVARGLVTTGANGFSDVFWKCFALSCAYVMALWSCYRSKFSGEADQGYHGSRSALTSSQPQLMGNIHKSFKREITGKAMSRRQISACFFC
jgi:hypothetical protein